MALRSLVKFTPFASKFIRRQLNHISPKVLVSSFSLPVFAVTKAKCENTPYNFNWDEDSLEHEFLIKQACTVNVNSASQLLTVTLVAIQDTSQRMRELLSQEIALVRQAMEWGDMRTPEEHWERLVSVRGQLIDLKHNLNMLTSYSEYAEKVATVVAELSFLSGNVGASDAICERIEQAARACGREREANHKLEAESLELQQTAILNSAQMEEIMKK